MFEPTSLPALPTGSSVSPPRKEESLQEGILVLALDLRQGISSLHLVLWCGPGTQALLTTTKCSVLHAEETHLASLFSDFTIQRCVSSF